jgi:hypothetical protein
MAKFKKRGTSTKKRNAISGRFHFVVKEKVILNDEQEFAAVFSIKLKKIQEEYFEEEIEKYKRLKLIILK